MTHDPVDSILLSPGVMLGLRGFWIVFVGLTIVTQGCGTAPKRHPLPKELYGRDIVSDIPDCRFLVDRPIPDSAEGIDHWYQQQKQSGLITKTGRASPEADFLALSGGGQNGAFGAGLLVGWTATGTRPQFLVVTGISTGALIAPFAFLGPDYDSTLKEIYTTISMEQIATEKSTLKVIGSNSFMDTEPLKRRIAEIIDVEILRSVAREHLRGRRLFVGTTNLDAGAGVVWNMGAIAASGKPGSLELFREILLAAASVPSAFPPILIPVSAAGKRYDEMHVDGGTVAQVFFYPFELQLKQQDITHHVDRKRRLYIIRNSRVRPEWKTVENKLESITERSVDVLIRTQGVGDLYRIYAVTRKDGVDYNLAYIPDDFEEKPQELFDVSYMNKLFDFGFNRSKTRMKWSHEPPGW